MIENAAFASDIHSGKAGCHEIIMSIPDGYEPYRRTPEFTHETVPSGLLKAHHTKAGVWGIIHVLEGNLLYRVTETLSEIVLTPETPGVIEPEQRHEVAPLGPVRFYVEFHRAPVASHYLGREIRS